MLRVFFVIHATGRNCSVSEKFARSLVFVCESFCTWTINERSVLVFSNTFYWSQATDDSQLQCNFIKRLSNFLLVFRGFSGFQLNSFESTGFIRVEETLLGSIALHCCGFNDDAYDTEILLETFYRNFFTLFMPCDIFRKTFSRREMR